MLEGLKKIMKSWLEINEGHDYAITIDIGLDFKANCIKNKIWMRGDPAELDQLYKQLENDDCNFWGSSPAEGIRKIHTGLPSMIVEVLTSIIAHDMNDIDCGDEWNKISKENHFKKLVKKAVSECLYIGDGAWKISLDKAISDGPIIEFVPGDECRFIYKRGRYRETMFETIYKHNGKRYILKETYGYGYVRYNLYDGTKEVSLNTVSECADLQDVIFDKTINMAIPMKFEESPKWKNRGKSIFDSKTSSYDALDEIVSQWADAVRSGRAISYIPETLIPRDPYTGRLLKPNKFDLRYIQVSDNLSETGKNEIEVKQPTIPSQNYLESYITFLDLCLQGVISPSTLGIDTKKLDNAEAQREKEKTTLYTRDKIIEELQQTIPLVVNTALKVLDIENKKIPRETEDVNISFGEYANPSFEAVVETVSKAKTGGIMSIEASVEELYGDSKDEEWKNEEVRRLKEEQGVTQVETPSVQFDLGG